jgi:hypothetical protein
VPDTAAQRNGGDVRTIEVSRKASGCIRFPASAAFPDHRALFGQENGQTWRALAVTFPDTISTHSTEQIFYFDATGKQQRLDYQPAVNGNTPVAQYTR